jgi:hypothetical protein
MVGRAAALGRLFGRIPERFDRRLSTRERSLREEGSAS